MVYNVMAESITPCMNPNIYLECRKAPFILLYFVPASVIMTVLLEVHIYCLAYAVLAPLACMTCTPLHLTYYNK